MIILISARKYVMSDQVCVQEKKSLYSYNNIVCTCIIDTHPGMMNVTSRLAVQIKYLPQGVVNWSDLQPQKKRSELSIHDVVPSEGDGLMMYNRAVDYVMWFMASHFKALSKFITQVPRLKSPHPVSQSIVAPMRILHQDEKYTEANIEILEQIMSDAQLKGDPQVCRYAYHYDYCVGKHVCTHTKSHPLIRW